MTTPDTEAEESAKLSKEELDAILREHSLVRTEIVERLRVAFSHVAYAGALVAFAIPLSDNVSKAFAWLPSASLVLPAVGLVCLLWVAVFNMLWIGNANFYLMRIEKRVNSNFDASILGWEHFASKIRKERVRMLPRGRDEDLFSEAELESRTPLRNRVRPQRARSEEG